MRAFCSSYIQTTSWAHSASYSKAPRVFSPRVKQSGYEHDHTPPSCANIKNEWRNISAPLICLHLMHMDKPHLYWGNLSTHNHKNFNLWFTCHNEKFPLNIQKYFLLFLWVYSKPKNISGITNLKHISIFQQTLYTPYNQNSDSARK
jgi:hypothetical protein